MEALEDGEADDDEDLPALEVPIKDGLGGQAGDPDDPDNVTAEDVYLPSSSDKGGEGRSVHNFSPGRRRVPQTYSISFGCPSHLAAAY